jgi:uncharacterized protein (DUF1800 family)
MFSKARNGYVTAYDEYEKDMLRPNALGNFCQLLGAIAHHPAMLYYLDNWLSSGVNTLEAKDPLQGAQ